MKTRLIRWILSGIVLIGLVTACNKDQAIVDQGEFVAVTLRDQPTGTPTVVADLPPVRITVPEGASKEVIRAELEKALKEAEKNAKDPEVKAAYRNLAKGMKDSDYQGMADELGELDGLTFNYFCVVTRKGDPVVIVVSVQILNPPPPDGNQELLIAHENGHSLIGNEVAKRCAAKAAQEADAAGKKGKEANQAIADKLKSLEDQAQAAYEARSNHGLNGTAAEQGIWAQEEADKVINAYLAS